MGTFPWIPSLPNPCNACLKRSYPGKLCSSLNGSHEERRNSTNFSSAFDPVTSRSNSVSIDPESADNSANNNAHDNDDSQTCQPNDDITDEEIRITLISSVEEKLKTKVTIT